MAEPAGLPGSSSVGEAQVLRNQPPSPGRASRPRRSINSRAVALQSPSILASPHSRARPAARARASPENLRGSSHAPVPDKEAAGAEDVADSPGPACIDEVGGKLMAGDHGGMVEVHQDEIGHRAFNHPGPPRWQKNRALRPWRPLGALRPGGGGHPRSGASGGGRLS